MGIARSRRRGEGLAVRRRVIGVLACSSVALVLVGCTSVGPGEGGASAGGSTGETDTGGTPSQSPPEILQGRYDVGGHELHMRCDGSGAVTVVYLHGLSHDGETEASGASAASLPELMAPHYRFCAYDRANTGASDDVPGPLTATTSARDLARLLDRAGLDPPYLLIGASFGGLVAEVFAALHPHDVRGLLLLDAGFPDELDLERLFPPDQRLAHGRDGFSGWAQTSENMDELAAYEDAASLVTRTPTIPMTYLLADPPSYDGPKAYLQAFPQELAEFAGRYSPGQVKKVPSDHYMEAAIPTVILQEVQNLLG